MSVLRKTVPEVSLLFPLFLQSSFMLFFKLLLLMFIFISHLVFYGLFLSTCWCCVFSFVRLFFLVSLPFFPLILLHSLSFFNKLLSICSWFSTTFSQFFHLFIYFFVATDPREPNFKYEEGNSFGDIYACFTSNKR